MSFQENNGNLHGKVCLVTGATRGIGKGIALALGSAGATVYITGRTMESKVLDSPGSLKITAAEIEKLGGRAVPLKYDHSREEDVRALFKHIETAEKGRLDLLVNNAYSALKFHMDAVSEPFWEMSTKHWDNVQDVGVRNTFLCTALASKMMVPRKRGLIINISSVGAIRYLFDVAYGVGKSAVDRITADCAMELTRHGVSIISLWPGMVKTEQMVKFATGDEYGEERRKFIQPGFLPDKMAKENASLFDTFSTAESPQFVGLCVLSLALDPDVIRNSGKALPTAEVGDMYKVIDPMQSQNGQTQGV